MVGVGAGVGAADLIYKNSKKKIVKVFFHVSPARRVKKKRVFSFFRPLYFLSARRVDVVRRCPAKTS